MQARGLLIGYGQLSKEFLPVKDGAHYYMRLSL